MEGARGEGTTAPQELVKLCSASLKMLAMGLSHEEVRTAATAGGDAAGSRSNSASSGSDDCQSTDAATATEDDVWTTDDGSDSEGGSGSEDSSSGASNSLGSSHVRRPKGTSPRSFYELSRSEWQDLGLVVDLLAAHPAAPHEKHAQGFHPLTVAIQKAAPPSVVAALLDAHPDAAKAVDNGDMMPLHHGVKGDYVSALLWLCSCASNNPTPPLTGPPKETRPLRCSCMHCNEFAVQQANADSVLLVLAAYPQAARHKCGRATPYFPVHVARAKKWGGRARADVIDALHAAW